MAEDNYLQTWMGDLSHELEKLKLAIYGDKNLPPEGKGGIYGELKRMRDETRSNSHDNKVAMAELDRRMSVLEEKFDALNNRIRPRWWDYVIIAGGGAIGLMLALQVLQILGLV